MQRETRTVPRSPGRSRAASGTGPAPMSRTHEGPLLVLYGRPRCHLCDVAKEALAPFVRSHALRIEERNVEDVPQWERDYGQSVPVGVLDGRRVFKYRVDPKRLERALDARAGDGREVP